MSSQVSLDYALKLLKEDPKITEITQGPVTIIKHWKEDGSLQVYLDDGGHIILDHVFNDVWTIKYSDNTEVN